MILPSDFGVYIQRKLKHDLKEISALSCSLLYYSQCHCCSVAQLCLSPCDPCSAPGFPVHHQLPELAQTHVHRVDDAIQPSHPLLSPSPPAFNLPQYQGLFQWVSSSQVDKALELQLQHQSFRWIFRIDLGLTGLISLQSKGLSRVFFSTTIWKHQFFGIQSSLWSNSHIHTQLTGKNHSFDYMDPCRQSNGSAF